MVVVDGQGLPIVGTLASASPAEVKLAEQTLEIVKVPRHGRGRPKKRPLRLLADKGYDSDQLRKRLKQFKIDLIAPHRKNRKRKMEENPGAIGNGVKLKKLSPGCLIFAAWLFAMIV